MTTNARGHAPIRVSFTYLPPSDVAFQSFSEAREYVRSRVEAWALGAYLPIVVVRDSNKTAGAFYVQVFCNAEVSEDVALGYLLEAKEFASIKPARESGADLPRGDTRVVFRTTEMADLHYEDKPEAWLRARDLIDKATGHRCSPWSLYLSRRERGEWTVTAYLPKLKADLLSVAVVDPTVTKAW